MSKPTIALGVSDYKTLAGEGNRFLIDKTLLIKEIIDTDDLVTIALRPRRFGKSLNLSMLKYFFSVKHKQDEYLFYDKLIWLQDNLNIQLYQKEQGKYPLLHISFASVSGLTFADCMGTMRALIADALLEYEDVIDIDMQDSPALWFSFAIKKLFQHYGEKVIVLIDEYDTPLQLAYTMGFWKEMSAFFREFFISTLKDNQYLRLAFITGVTRVAKESIFSGLNHVVVNTVVSDAYKDSFGFTEDEVQNALSLYDMNDKSDEVRRWYNGYVFGSAAGNGINIYNPWSVVNYIKNNRPHAYWVNTASNELISTVLAKAGFSVRNDMQALLSRQTIETHYNEYTVYNDIYINDDLIWSLFISTGYLKVISFIDCAWQRVSVAIPNNEILYCFERIVSEWFSRTRDEYDQFCDALLKAEPEDMESCLQILTDEMFSYFDVGRNNAEGFYHAFVLGMLVKLRPEYIVTSNRESGRGRYDIMIEPVDNVSRAGIGYIIEFKIHDNRRYDSVEETILSAFEQIHSKGYETALRSRGIDRIVKYVVCFEGKMVSVRMAV